MAENLKKRILCLFFKRLSWILLTGILAISAHADEKKFFSKIAKYQGDVISLVFTGKKEENIQDTIKNVLKDYVDFNVKLEASVPEKGCIDKECGTIVNFTVAGPAMDDKQFEFYDKSHEVLRIMDQLNNNAKLSATFANDPNMVEHFDNQNIEAGFNYGKAISALQGLSPKYKNIYATDVQQNYKKYYTKKSVK